MSKRRRYLTREEERREKEIGLLHYEGVAPFRPKQLELFNVRLFEKGRSNNK